MFGLDGEMLGIMPTRDALRLAESQDMDLVETSPNADPPVCKIMDFGKFRYEESLKRKEARKKQSRQQTKEVKFHPGTDENDINVKVRKIKEFIDDGDKVKVSLQYRGRENAHREIGFELIGRVIKLCEEFTQLEQAPKLMGKVLGCLLAPVSMKGKTKAQPPSAKPATAPVRPPVQPAPPVQQPPQAKLEEVPVKPVEVTPAPEQPPQA